MDRFSWALWNEGKITPSEHAQIIEEMQEENKRDLVQSYVWSCQELNGTLPDVRDVLDRFQDISLDPDRINEIIEDTKQMSE